MKRPRNPATGARSELTFTQAYREKVEGARYFVDLRPRGIPAVTKVFTVEKANVQARLARVGQSVLCFEAASVRMNQQMFAIEK